MQCIVGLCACLLLVRAYVMGACGAQIGQRGFCKMERGEWDTRRRVVGTPYCTPLRTGGLNACSSMSVRPPSAGHLFVHTLVLALCRRRQSARLRRSTSARCQVVHVGGSNHLAVSCARGSQRVGRRDGFTRCTDSRGTVGQRGGTSFYRTCREGCGESSMGRWRFRPPTFRTLWMRRRCSSSCSAVPSASWPFEAQACEPGVGQERCEG